MWKQELQHTSPPQGKHKATNHINDPHSATRCLFGNCERNNHGWVTLEHYKCREYIRCRPAKRPADLGERRERRAGRTRDMEKILVNILEGDGTGKTSASRAKNTKEGENKEQLEGLPE